MTMKFSVAVRNAMLDAFEATVGPNAILKIFAGAAPADCAASDTGAAIASLSLPTDWMAAASGGAKALSGTWQDVSADNAGSVGHFRLYASDGATCHHQGSVTVTGGGGDLTLDNVAIAVGEPVTITAFTITAPNA